MFKIHKKELKVLQDLNEDDEQKNRMVMVKEQQDEAMSEFAREKHTFIYGKNGMGYYVNADGVPAIS